MSGQIHELVTISYRRRCRYNGYKKITVLRMQGCIQYLAHNFPEALSYAQRTRFSNKQIADLSAILNLIRESNLEILPSEIQTSGKVDNGSFGSIFKATFRGKVVVLKRIEQV